ncbi:hypothetical protein MDAP_000691 [Mitosporidium daphniae]
MATNKTDEEWMEFKALPKELLAFLTNISSLLVKVKECEESWAKISSMFPLESKDPSKEPFFGSGYRALHMASNAIFRFIQKSITVHEANAHGLVESMRIIETIEKESSAWDSIRKISEATYGQLSSLSTDLSSSFSSSTSRADLVCLEDPMTRNSFNSKLVSWRHQVEAEQRKISDQAQQELIDPVKEIAIFFTSSLIQMASERRNHLRSEDAFLEELLSVITSASDLAASDTKFKYISHLKSCNYSKDHIEKSSMDFGDSKVVLSGFLKLKKSSLFTTGWPISFVVLTQTPSDFSSYLHIIPLDKCVISSILNQEQEPLSSFKPVSSFQKWNNPQLPSLVSSYLLGKYFYPEYQTTSSFAVPRFNSFCAQLAFPPGTLSFSMQEKGERKENFIVSALVTSSSNTLLLKVATASSAFHSLELRAVPVANNPTTSEWLCVINDAVHIPLSKRHSIASNEHREVESHSDYYGMPQSYSQEAISTFRGERALYIRPGSRDNFAEDDGWSVELSDLSLNNEDDPASRSSFDRNSLYSNSPSLVEETSASYFPEQFPTCDSSAVWTPSPIDDPWRSS